MVKTLSVAIDKVVCLSAGVLHHTDVTSADLNVALLRGPFRSLLIVSLTALSQMLFHVLHSQLSNRQLQVAWQIDAVVSHQLVDLSLLLSAQLVFTSEGSNHGG